MEIRPYINFKGECQEAIDIYREAFDCEVLEISYFSDIPKDSNEPIEISDEQKKWILQGTLKFGNNFIRVSDCLGELNDVESERIAIVVEGIIDEIKHAFSTLSKEGRIGIPLQKTFFSPCHGVVFDKFGVMWNLFAYND